MSCPECEGLQAKTDPRWILRSLCDEHVASLTPPSDEEILAAFEEGLRARQACLDAKTATFDLNLRFR